jgi:hypothetical protein
MISDNSSQFSRSSSISSASSKSPTNSRDLARLAAFNSGGLAASKSSTYYDLDQVTILGSGPLTAEPLCSPDLERLYVVEEIETHPLGPVDVYVPSSSQYYELDSHRKARKRGRSSVDLALQQQVRNLLVMPTPTRSQAEMAYPYSSWSPKALQSPGRSSPERMPVQNLLNRKRFCYDADGANLTRPEGGPGMWKGIL